MPSLYRWLRRGFIFLLYFTIAASTFTIFSTDPGVNVDPRDSMDVMLSGTAHRPFAYRPLMPLVVNALERGFTDSLWQKFVHYRWQQAIDHELYRAGIDKTFVRQWYLFKWLAICCFAGFGACMFSLLRSFYKVELTEAHFLALLGIAFLPVFFGPANLLYDPTSLLLFPLAFICLIHQRVGWYYLVFLLAVVNKELSILLIPLFALNSWKHLSKGWLAFHIALQIVVYALLSLSIRYYFAHNPGGAFEDKLFYNFSFLITPSLLLIVFLIKIGVLTSLIVIGWKQKDRLLKQSFLILALPILVLMVIAGRLSEIRVFYEAVFLIYLLAVPTVKQILLRRI